MLIQLSKLLSTAEHEEVVTAHLDIDQIRLRNSEYPILKKEEFQLHMMNVGKKEVSLKFDTTVVLGIPCDRCLSEVQVPIDIHVMTAIDFGDMDTCEDEKPFIYDESNLDVDLFVYDEIIPLLPTKVLCKEDCKGLCPVCGTNRNEKDCDCDTTVPDPRMAAIQDIFKNFKEV